MSENDILGLVKSHLEKHEEKINESIDAHNAAAIRNNKAATESLKQVERMQKVTKTTLTLLAVFAVFFLVISGSGIGMASDLYANKANKDDVVSNEVYKAVSRLSARHYERIIYNLSGDSLVVKKANEEYYYAIKEIIDHGGVRGHKK